MMTAPYTTVAILLAVYCCHSETACPGAGHWLHVRGRCYTITQNPRHTATVFGKREMCRSLGGDLASFPDHSAEDAVYQWLRDNNKLGPYVSEYVFIGANDLVDEGHFVWMNGEEVTDIRWDKQGVPGQPDNKTRDGRSRPEDCVAVKGVTDTAAGARPQVKWHDFPCCAKNKFAALCSRDAKDKRESPSRAAKILYEECLNDTDNCKNHECENGGECVDGVDNYSCTCRHGYSGKRCQSEMLCLPPPDVSNSTTFPRPISSDGKHLYGDQIVVTCNPGYFYKNRTLERNYTCNRGSPDYWGPRVQSCLPVKCLPVPRWRDLVVDFDDRSYGSVINYTCKDDKILVDVTLPEGYTHAQTTCNGIGVWEPPFGDCIDSHEMRHSKLNVKVTEAAGAMAIGTVAFIFVVSEICVIVFMDFTHLCSHVTFCISNLRRRR